MQLMRGHPGSRVLLRGGGASLRLRGVGKRLGDAMGAGADANGFIAAMGLITDDRFVVIQRRAMDRPLLWDEFRIMEMPSGMTPEQTWELLSVMRYQTAVWLPYRSDEGKVGWYSITRTVMEHLNAIDRYCCPDSWIAVTLASRSMVYSLIEQLVRETVTVLRYDGVKVTYEETRKVLFGEQRPESPEQKVVQSIKELIWGTGLPEGETIDRGFIDRVFARLTDKCSCKTRNLRVRSENDAWMNRNMNPEDALGLIVNMANGMSVDPAQHPLLIAQGMDTLFRLCLPLPSFNTTVSWIVRRRYFMKNRLPVLASVPLMSIEDEWDHDIRKPITLDLDFKDSIVSLPESVDFTAYIAGYVEIVREEIERIDAELHRRIEGDAAFEEVLQHDPEINYRQRSVLLRCLEDPDAVFRIDAQQMAFNVTYATARADLLKLEDLGLLDRMTVGRAFVFTPKPGFEQIVGRRWPEAVVSGDARRKTPRPPRAL